MVIYSIHIRFWPTLVIAQQHEACIHHTSATTHTHTHTHTHTCARSLLDVANVACDEVHPRLNTFVIQIQTKLN